MKHDETVSQTEYTDFTQDFGNSESLVSDTLGVSRALADAGSYGETEPDDEGVTMPEYVMEAQEGPVAPVVGWLVCTSGLCKGKAFQLHGGYNQIGRARNCDVIITDTKVDAKTPMGWIAYTAEDSSYDIGANSGTINVLFHNGKKLLAAQSRTPEPYDRIRMGDTELMFVPLCGENFKWEE